MKGERDEEGLEGGREELKSKDQALEKGVGQKWRKYSPKSKRK